jgi:hypothetical protein
MTSFMRKANVKRRLLRNASLIWKEWYMGGINRNAGSNLKLRNSGLLSEELRSFKIRKVENEVYTLVKGEIIVVLDARKGKRV